MLTLQDVLEYLRQRGQQLDAEIAAATGIPLAEVRLRLSELAKRGDIVTCRSIRFINGEKSEGTLCRATGSAPAVTPVRKPKARKPRKKKTQPTI